MTGLLLDFQKPIFIRAKRKINGIKRCRIVKDVFRNTKDMYDDLTMEIACGLHNFRVECRHAKTVNPYSR
jgi:hypothetical protein